MAKRPTNSKSSKLPDRLSWLDVFDPGPTFLQMDIPYVPMKMEDVEFYMKSPNYEKNCIKQIETIGFLEAVCPGTASLISTKGEPRIKLTLDIQNLKEDWAYPIGFNGVCRGLRHAGSPVKIFGNLKTSKDGIIIVVDFYVKVENLLQCETILSAMSRIPRRGFSTWTREPAKNEELQRYRNRLQKQPEQR